MMGEVDVAIVGAGAAGIGAARRARDYGFSFVLLDLPLKFPPTGIRVTA